MSVDKALVLAPSVEANVGRTGIIGILSETGAGGAVGPGHARPNLALLAGTAVVAVPAVGNGRVRARTGQALVPGAGVAVVGTGDFVIGDTLALPARQTGVEIGAFVAVVAGGSGVHALALRIDLTQG